MKTYPLLRFSSACRVIPLVVFVLCVIFSGARAQDVDLARLNAFKAYRSPSRRFVVVGTNTLDNVEAGRWAETLCGRVEGVVGGALPFRRREIRIVIRPASHAVTATDTNDVCSLGALTQGLDDGRLVQRMVLPKVECLREPSARRAFCRLLLAGLFPSCRTRVEPVKIPRWLIVGLERNLWRTQRGEDAFAMVERWRAGRVPPLADWLARISSAWDPSLDGPMSGLLMAWLLEPPKGYTLLQVLCQALDQGHPIGVDLLATSVLGEGGRPADLEIAWDRWIMRQQRKVFRPGTLPADVLKQLAAELLLYPGTFGIPLSCDIKRGSGFEALIGLRKAEWIDRFCRAKTTSLRAVAVGRGAAVQQTVERYGLFLDALSRGKKVGRLKRLLAEAQAARHDLENRGRRDDARSAQ